MHLNTLQRSVEQQSNIPPIAPRTFSLPAPKAQSKPETYSVVVSGIKVQDLLFALARDARINIDIHPGLSGNVTLNALDQTLPQLLARIAKQVDMRFELDGQNLLVMPDTPFLRNYKIDYVNLTRDTTSTISVASQIGSASGSENDAASIQNQTAGSGSFARIQNTSKNRFWDSLIQNIKDLLRETDKVLPEGSLERTVLVDTQGSTTQKETRKNKTEGAITKTGGDNTSSAATTERVTTFREAASVIANVETGVISVRATSRQQEKVQEFLDRVMTSAKRQVLIEATIAEVQLTQNYQQGIDWSALNIFDTGFRIIQKAAGTIAGTRSSSLVELGYDSSRGQFTSAVRLLESFGTVKVLSSPKLSVLNNQTAVMKVVDDNVYFTYEIKETDATTTAASKTTITSTLHSVPVGLVLTVTPLVSEDDSVTLNIRPSLSRVIAEKTDPSLQLMKAGATITNTIPIIRAREFDSVMRINNGNIAVMGGLMEDSISDSDDTIPGLANTKLIGGLFQNRNNTKLKTELVIFVRPTIVRTPSLDGDYHRFASLVPSSHFFDMSTGPTATPSPGTQR